MEHITKLSYLLGLGLLVFGYLVKGDNLTSNKDKALGYLLMALGSLVFVFIFSVLFPIYFLAGISFCLGFLFIGKSIKYYTKYNNEK